MRKKVTYRPGKAQGVFGVLYGGVFILIGLFVAIPAFGLFGVLWTLMALGMTGYNAYCAFGKGYAGPEIAIEEDAAPSAGGAPSPEGGTSPSAGTASAQNRLEEARSLYDGGLITREEYEEKRREILNEL